MFNTSNLTRYAVNYLSKFSSSKSNLERILKNKIRRLEIEKKDKYSLYESIDEVINKLEILNLISDSNYASSKIRNFVLHGKSRIFIKAYLIQKGVKSETISEAIKSYDHKNSDWELDAARTYVRKKRFSNTIKDKNKNLSKMARAGFTYDVSNKILDEINDV